MVSEQCLRASLRCPAATRAACLSAVPAARALPACTRDDYCTRAASPRKLPTRARAACPPAPPAWERRLPASCLPAHPLPARWRCLPASATCAHALPSCAAKRASPLPARVLPARERPYLHALLLLLRSPIAAAAATATTTSTGTTAAAASPATMATISVLSFDAEGRPISFDSSRGGAEPGGSGPGSATAEGAEPGGAELGGTVPGAAELGGAGSGGARSGAAEPGGATSGAVEPGVSPAAASRREPLSPPELREWFARCWRRASGAGAPEGVGAETTAVCPGGGSTTGAAGGPAAGGLGGAGVVTEGAGAVSAESGVAARPRPYFVPLLQQVLGLSPPVECPQPVQSQSLLEPSSPLRAPSPYAGPTGGLAERREPASRPVSPVRAARTSGRGSRLRPPPVPGTHRMSLRPSTAPLRAPLPSPPESSLPVLADPASDSLRAASPTVTRLLATVVTDPSFESTTPSALVAELVDFAARCRLDYAASLVSESASDCPLSVGGDCALGTDVLEDRQEELQCLAAASPHLASVLLAPEGDPDALDIPTPRSYAEAVEGPYSSQWQAAMDAEMASWKSTGTYVDAVPPPGANIVSGMWIFRVKRPPGSPPVFKARYVARGFSQRQGVDYFQTFSPTPKMTTLRVLLHIAAQRDYELHSLDFSTACEAEIYAGAMAAQELRWLTYLLTDLGEPPRSPPVLYVDNKALLALCREQRLEHRTKHIALRYFLARELQQRGQLRLAYVASEANTADVFTKALAPCDHQRLCTQLGLVPVLPHLLSS
ncbi:unnamed protein product [Closterium sp. NIES-54]